MRSARLTFKHTDDKPTCILTHTDDQIINKFYGVSIPRCHVIINNYMYRSNVLIKSTHNMPSMYRFTGNPLQMYSECNHIMLELDTSIDVDVILYYSVKDSPDIPSPQYTCFYFGTLTNISPHWNTVCQIAIEKANDVKAIKDTINILERIPFIQDKLYTTEYYITLRGFSGRPECNMTRQLNEIGGKYCSLKDKTVTADLLFFDIMSAIMYIQLYISSRIDRDNPEITLQAYSPYNYPKDMINNYRDYMLRRNKCKCDVPNTSSPLIGVYGAKMYDLYIANRKYYNTFRARDVKDATYPVADII